MCLGVDNKPLEVDARLVILRPSPQPYTQWRRANCAVILYRMDESIEALANVGGNRHLQHIEIFERFGDPEALHPVKKAGVDPADVAQGGVAILCPQVLLNLRLDLVFSNLNLRACK